MAKPEMVKFSRIAGATMLWRYMRNHPYGSGRPGVRPLRKSVLDKLTAAFVDMGFMCRLGTPHTIVSAGAWVPESTQRGPNDKHVQGRAIDIDALHWTLTSGLMDSPRILLTKQYPHYPEFYLGVEACFRRYFGTVLGFLYNKKHRGHWHLDDGSKVCYRESSRSRVLFVQASLSHIWSYKPIGPLDGEVGTLTRAGIKYIREFLGLTKPLTAAESWQRYLMATAITGMNRVDDLDKSL